MLKFKKLKKRLGRQSNQLYPLAVILAIYTFYTRYKSLESLQSDAAVRQMQSGTMVGKSVSNTSYDLSLQQQNRPWKNIVWYELWHGGLRMNARSVNMSLCEYKQCTINFIDNKQQHDDYFQSADAVIFQGGRLPKSPPSRAHENQVYVFSTVESPIHLVFTYGGKSWIGAINWTMTYRLDSDIQYKYGSFKLRNETSLPENKDYSTIFRRKKKEVAWLVSDCNTESKREQYVKVLQKYVKVDIYGLCGPFKNCTKEEGIKCLEQIGKDYKFYLSFENSMCKDYMTEKVFVWFNMDIITVVRGARNYRKLLPKNTYIDAHPFNSAERLGKFLNRLSKNEKEYINYLKEKDKYRTESLLAQVQRAYCDLCKKLHNVDDNRKTYQSVNRWWFQNACQRTVNDIHTVKSNTGDKQLSELEEEEYDIPQ